MLKFVYVFAPELDLSIRPLNVLKRVSRAFCTFLNGPSSALQHSNVKNVHPVSSAWTRTHDIQIMSLLL